MSYQEHHATVDFIDPTLVSHPEISKGKVALVYMPWGAASRASIAASILKECARLHGYSCDVHYLNIWFAQQIGVDLYSKISEGYAFSPEWFFSCELFGKNGLDVLNNGWSDLSETNGEQLRRELAKMVDGFDISCEKLAHEAVPQFINQCVQEIDWSAYMAVGFSSSFAQNTACLLLAQRIRQAHPGIKIMFGGPNLDSEMGFEILKGFEWIDYVVHGEAEDSFPLLLENISSGNDYNPVPGVSIRKGSELISGYKTVQPFQDLNKSPLPDFSDFFQQIEHSGLHKKLRLSVPFESARGCWWGAKHHCTFCGLNGTGMAFRKKNPARVYEELLSISGTYRCLTLNAVDNIMAMEYFTQLLPRVADTGIDFNLFYEVKANLTRNQMKAMSDAGVKRIQPGIESMNTRLLRLMRKGVTAIQNVQLLKWCHEFGISPSWNVLYGFPGESPEDYKDYPYTFRLLSHLSAPSGIGPVVFERFSPYHFEREKFKLTLHPQMYYKLIFPESRIDMEKVAYYFDGAWEGQDSSFDYIAPSREFVAAWQRSWKEKSIFCYYEKGPNFLTINDNRPIKDATSVAGRRTTLNSLQSKAYLFCDQHRSFRAIHEMLTKEERPDLAPEDTRTMLQQLVEAGLVFQEEDHYLALAVHKRSQSFVD
jgi:ribosomal peptide maturation radical SAM protein 1